MNAFLSTPVLSWLLSYLFNALWQIPLLFAAAWIVTRMLYRTHPRIGHRIWVGALLLQIALPACNLHVASLWHALLNLLPSTGSVSNGGVHILMGSAATAGGGTLRLPLTLETGLVLAWVCCILYFAARLVLGLWQTRTLACTATRLTLTGDTALRWSQYCHRFGITVPLPEIAASSQGIGPVTVGIRHGLLLLPPHFLDTVAANDLDAVLAHELAHVARRDFAKNLLYGLISMPVAWHPLLWRTRARIAESRELLCDDAAADAIAAQTAAGRRQYAQSLLRVASILSGRPQVATLQTIGILGFNADSRTFERRVMTLTRNRIPMTTTRRIFVAASCCVVALATCTTALALRTDVAAPAQAASESQQPKKISISSNVMSGLKISGENPTYPKEARAKKIQGAVVIDAIIGKDGAIKNLHVVKSPSKSLSESALKAVRTWRYQPYHLNGEPVEVNTTINVVYNLEP
jgi:bla regulator protein blaR1